MLWKLVCAFALLRCAFGQLSCPQGYNLFQDRCYRFNRNALATYEDAMTNCTTTGDNLVSIHDDATNNYIRALDSNGVRIGLEYNYNTFVYSWSDRSSFDYDRTSETFSEWAPYFGNCAINIDGEWKNAECRDKFKYACYKEATEPSINEVCPDKSTIYTTPTTISSPGYPEEYDLHTDRGNCVYKVSAPAGQHIKINFDELVLVENEGYFAIFKNAEDDFSYVEADNDFHGLFVIVENNFALLELVGSLRGKYKLTVTAVTPESSTTSNNVCPDKNRVYVVPRTILSPGYPNNFSLPIQTPQCIYLIAAKMKFGIRVNLKEISTDRDYGFMYGYGSFSEALAVGDNPIGDYDHRSSGEVYYYSTNTFGVTMAGRYPGRFNIEFIAF